jgi:predicted lipoprotein with Yx(FWY)xxD motif
MTRGKSLSFLGVAAVPAAALAVAGCGGGGGGATAASPAPKTSSGHAATVGVATTGLGKILVDSKGRTVYLFKKDMGTKSACFGACAGAWPPVRAGGKPTVGGGVKASLVGTTRRSDGAPQVTYNGHPLYLFTGDQKPGQTTGQGVKAFGAAWFAVSPAGSQASGAASNSGSPSSSGGGGGY